MNTLKIEKIHPNLEYMKKTKMLKKWFWDWVKYWGIKEIRNMMTWIKLKIEKNSVLFRADIS